MNIAKYAFPSKEFAQERIAEQQDKGHVFVELRFLVKVQGEYDQEGNVIVEPIYRNRYSVDVMWKGLETHPEGWELYYIDLLDEGAHMFAGCYYEDYKFTTL
jgi:hypothetical protein